MSLNYSLDSYSFEGYGDDPTLANARTKTDKDISGIIQGTTENQVTYYQYANVDDITFGSEQEVSLAKLRFTSAQKTTVKILHEFIFDMLSDLASEGSYELRYYLDDELLSYVPYERLGGIYGATSGNSEFSIARDFFYILKDVDPNVRHTWEVKMIAHGIDSVSIDANHAHVVIEGQRMYGDSYFDGFIEAEDVLTIIPYGNLALVSVSDSAEIALVNAAIGQGTDVIGMYDFTTMTVSQITEGTGSLSPHIFLQTEYGHILTESGDYLTTESGDRLIL